MAVIPVASLRLNSAFKIIIFYKNYLLLYSTVAHALLIIITFQLRSIDMMIIIIIENSVFVLYSEYWNEVNGSLGIFNVTTPFLSTQLQSSCRLLDYHNYKFKLFKTPAIWFNDIFNLILMV